jgi:hypothetical protein
MQESIRGRAVRKRERAATWEQRLEARQQSGIPVRTFCRQEGIGISTYYRWHLKLTGRVRKARRRPTDGRPVDTPFIPVHVRQEADSWSAPAAGTWACEVTGPRRVRLRLRERPDWRELLQLLAVMAGDA